MRRFLTKEQGDTIVEATIVYPVTILVFFVLLYASIFLCQRANLQANLEDALIYYKNVGTDTYVYVNDKMTFQKEGETISADGNHYEVSQKLNPYRRIGKAIGNAVGYEEISSDKFSEFFHSSCGHMFFYSGKNVKVELESVTDAVLYRKIKARATQTVETPINIAMVGATNSMTIAAEATVIVIDGDDTIRDIDFAGDIIKNTKLGEAVTDAAGKAMDYYDELKGKLGI